MEKKLDSMILDTENYLIHNLSFGELINPEAGLTSAKFNAAKKWLVQNNSAITKGRKNYSNISVSELDELAEDGGYNTKASSEVARMIKNYNPDSGFTMDQFFRDSIKGQSGVKRLAIRRAIANQLRKKLMSPGHSARINTAQNWLKTCMNEVKQTNPKTEKVAGDGFKPGGEITRDQSNYGKCESGYQQLSSVTGYYKPGSHPYILYDTEKKECFIQKGNLGYKDGVVINGVPTPVRTLTVVDPNNSARGHGPLDLVDSLFDVGTPNTANKRFQLFGFDECPPTVADSNPLKAGDESVSDW